jgi:hypothetical protein
MRIKVAIILVFLCFHFGATAQDDDPLNTTFFITREARHSIPDPVKLHVIPTDEKPRSQKNEIVYRSKLLYYDVENEVEKVPAVRMKSPRSEELHRFFVKGGLGNYSNTSLAIRYNTIHFRGRSTVKNSQGNDHYAGLFFQKEWKDHTLKSRVFFDQQSNHYYGYNQDTLKLEKKDIKHRFLTVGSNFAFDNQNQENASISYQCKPGFYFLSDNLNSSELGISFSGFVQQDFEGNPIKVELDFHYFNYDTTKNVLSRNVFQIRSRYMIKQTGYDLDIGFRIASESENNKNYFHFYPDIEIRSKLMEKMLIAFAGISGNLNINSFSSLSKENPYISGNIYLRNTNNPLELYAGVKGNLNTRINYMFRMAHKNFKYLQFFVNDSLDAKKFIALYDSSNSTLFEMDAELSLEASRNLKLFLALNYCNYNISQEKHPWHLPDASFKAGLQYNIQKKIFVSADLFLLGSRKAIIYQNNSIATLDPVFDLNTSFEYRFSHSASLFFNFNNIFGNKYSFWNFYELRGFHVLGGLILKF